ncbi:sirohydrochlorin ferrochelatase, chloroplastic-like [Carica papaya]|uniref:sirohydrochlorin ferrochelatase, chloroplastic-like n=1 Tax=Carica papaya TaxID=3649 RepID=UPI000B8CE5D9|nr:sirohydrochlorin ferrochelatase, chloroplastic-like [Carica papaya]
MEGSETVGSSVNADEFVAMFRYKTGFQIVEPAHMELAEPSITDAFGSCVQQGANGVIVSAFFLFPGRHWHQDIPSLTANAAKEYPGRSYIITAPLGLHKLLVDIPSLTANAAKEYLGVPYIITAQAPCDKEEQVSERDPQDDCE